MTNSFYINNTENRLEQEKRGIRNTAMFVGIALIITWIISQIWSYFYFAVLRQFGFNNTEAAALFYDPTVSYLVNIIISVISFTLPFLIIPAGSNKKLRETVSFAPPVKGSFWPTLFIGVGICGFSNIASNILLSLLGRLGMTVPEAGSSPEISGGLFGMGVAFIATVIIAPLVEEFAFRGAVLGGMRKYGDGPAIIISAVMFGLVHGNLRQIPFAFLSGIALGFITVKSGSLWMSIIAHAVNNGIAFASSLLANRLSAETLIVFNVFLLVLLTLCLFAAVALPACRSAEFFKISKAETETPETGSAIIFFTSPFIIGYIVLVIIRVASTF